ncbi:energy-coupled thiamine transporter ThiT [Vulcanibacillus modesticaldus]|uniref:Energy-coupled thiamine transporter ThiT n=1 Tax=Vulcanibacillus modesticaldus TaxID=337097 RepID=A0A1D2YU02_9BACI|nr:energy-coupled thiamine transporter ThiT [Vulcanibacillus modesticaldus]OEF99190.1 energy-coupled thiamine transporter ThiT [Vulcanibacillus modesticaldus]
MNNRIRIMTEIAIIAALAVLLNAIKVYEAPFGGSVSLVMVPIFLLAFRRGIVPAIIAGALTGTIKIILGAYIVHPVQFLLDYPVAFALLGFAGIVKINKNLSLKQKSIYLTIGIIFASSLRLLSHFVSGVIWFGQYAPENMNVYLYSLLYNLYYLVPEMIISIIVSIFIINKIPNFFIREDN